MKITWITDCSDNVFDHSGILVLEDCEYDRDGRLDDEDYICDDPIYELTEDGQHLYERWADDASVGYSLGDGKAKGLAQSFTEAQMYELLINNYTVN